ncbi:MAG: septum formation inhibitor [Bacteroidales bacterium]|nr:septum formation inhibitor [Bacteroidales bacterium]
MRRIKIIIKDFLEKNQDKKIYKFFKFITGHPYITIFIGIIIFTLFFDEYNIINRTKEYIKTKNLKAEVEYYQNKIYEDSIKLHELKTNNNNLTKFAREQYLMKADNEDIFIIKEK